ncbi:MAG: caspase family protein [Paludibacteraceae bacterium]|nr:caspase family protein [Paludibacteraceae bacterium]
MKRTYFFIIACITILTNLNAQEVQPGYSPSDGGHGLYNNRTKTWMVSPKYSGSEVIGNYDGVYYYALKDPTNGLWGIISSKNYQQWIYSPQFTNIYFGGEYGLYFFPKSGGMFCASKKTDWGLFDTEENIILPFKYKSISCRDYNCKVIVYDWDGKNYCYEYADLRKIKNQQAEARRQQEELKKKEDEERLKKLAEMKEKKRKEEELASFTTYAQNFVQPKIAQWQQKGEFEKTEAYRQRVTGGNRQQKIDSLTTVAEQQFISEHAALNPLQQLTINGNYDADHEVYRLESPKFGMLLVNVPIADAPSFKSNFTNIECRNATYFIENDKIALRSVIFYNPDTKKSYTYSNRAALNYTTYNIDADALGLQAFTISSGNNRQTVAAAEKPKVHILEPSANSQYSSPELTIRCNIETSDGSTPALYVEINGGEAIMLTPKQQMQKKGAKPMEGNEYTLTLPTDRDRVCNLAFYAIGNNDVPSEVKKLTLKYVGEQPKPMLHLYAVGVSDYASDDLQNLKYAAKDAQQFADVVKTAAGNLYRGVKPQVIVNKSATKQNVEQSLAQLARDVRQDDVIMLFFSGHGVREGEDTYFMTTDGIAADPAPTSIDFGYIKKRLNAMVQKGCKVVLFMDACHSGAMQTKSGTRDLSMTLPGMIGFYSSTRLEESAESDKLGNGAFTRALLDGISGKAANGKGEVTTTALRNYIEAEVSKVNDKQTPLTQNELGEVVLFKIKK